MSLLDLLTRIAGVSGAELIAFLERAGAQAPDLKPKADEWIAALNTALSADNLVAVGGAILAELGQVGQGKFSGRPHPSDL